MSAWKRLVVGSILMIGVSHAALADDPPAQVGRISYIEGAVSFQADGAPWDYATLNYPVLSGSAFWTEPNARSEIQLGGAEIRLDHLTELQVVKADESAVQLQVPQGVVNIHFAVPPVAGGIEVVTPLGAVELTKPGTYHIDSGQPTADMPAGQVRLTALEGEMIIQGPNSRLDVLPGETAVLSGNPPTYSLEEGNATAFDDWALARERREETHYAAQYVSPRVTGYEDLDNYGQWATDPQYGAIWYPASVDSSWAPYRNGHWAYILPWGWTWVDDAPWGFAPFHYGRWAYNHERWGWVPGQFVERPVYAPALVVFVGGGGWHPFSGPANISAVGWVPLAPHEVFHPYYPVSETYLRNVNRTTINSTQINSLTFNTIRNTTINNYINQRNVTVVPSTVLAQSQPVRRAFVPVSQAQLARATVTPAMAHVTPLPAAREEGRPIPGRDLTALPPARTAQPSSSAPGRFTAQPRAVPAPFVRSPEPPHSPTAPNVPEVRAVQAPTRPSTASKEMSRRETPLIAYRAGNSQVPRPPVKVRMPTSPDRENLAQNAKPRTEPAKSEVMQEIRHPEQHSRIEPTRQGWQRNAGKPQLEHPATGHPPERGQGEARRP